ncbi:uncharacterized protein TNCV_2342961 [Trichonephila clavipes]|nr:uncharacterized protein TNCV_2342961 [Trichonephila clavipes]
MDGLKDGEIQRAVRMVDIQDLKSALKLEATSHIDCHFIQGAGVTAYAPGESSYMNEIKKLREEVQVLKAQCQNQRSHSTMCWR